MADFTINENDPDHEGGSITAGSYHPHTFPLALVDAIIDGKHSLYGLEQAVQYRAMTRGKQFSVSSMSELVGENLVGKTAHIYYRNYEDSEWITITEVLSVVEDGDDGTYKFRFNTSAERCWRGECEEHVDDDDCDELPEGISYSFSAWEEVIVVSD
jgi:hypothetical protein